jgi:beta-1,4-mannosyl-glycoprotein beta-1,4-N-acetylglucosaminyltransferase
MVYDTFPLNNELDLLEIRLIELDSVVDKFVIAELPILYKGNDRELTGIMDMKRFEPWRHKMVYLTQDKETIHKSLPNKFVPNDVEKFQRNLILKYVDSVMEPDDVIIHGDVDEIPKATMVKMFVNSNYEKVVFKTKLFRYYYNLYFQDWKHLFAIRGKFLKGTKCLDTLRKQYTDRWVRVENAGWHFSSVGSFASIMRKFKDMDCFGPQKFNKKLGTASRIKERIEKRLHPFKDGKNQGKVMSLRHMPLAIQNDMKYWKYLTKDK